MILTTTAKIQAFIEAAFTTANPVFEAAWADISATAFVPSSLTGVLNGATAVDVVAAPGSNVRHVKEIHIFNADTVAHTITVQILDSANTRILVAVLVPSKNFLRYGQETGWQVGTFTGPGTVTSVAVAVPAYMSSSGGPITTAGTITLGFNNEAANLVFAGPGTGAAATPAFRTLVAADIPDISATYVKKAGDTMTGALRLPDGSVAAPSAAFGAGDTGFSNATVSGGPDTFTASLNGVAVQTQKLLVAGSTVPFMTWGGGSSSPIGTNINYEFRSNDPSATAAPTRFSIAANSTCSLIVTRVDTSGTAPSYNAQHARGTLALPTVLSSGDNVVSNIYSGYSGAAYLEVASLNAACVAATPSTTDMAGRFILNVTSGVTRTEHTRWDSVGISMGGANPFINLARTFIARPYTLATLPTATSQGIVWCSDLGGGAGLLQSDGTTWYRAGQEGFETQTTATGAVTLTTLTRAVNQFYNTILTGNVTVTLATTDAFGAAPKAGSRFRVVRGAAATGASTFTVSGKALGVSTWADFNWSGTAWVETASGSL